MSFKPSLHSEQLPQRIIVAAVPVPFPSHHPPAQPARDGEVGLGGTCEEGAHYEITYRHAQTRKRSVNRRGVGSAAGAHPVPHSPAEPAGPAESGDWVPGNFFPRLVFSCFGPPSPPLSPTQRRREADSPSTARLSSVPLRPTRAIRAAASKPGPKSAAVGAEKQSARPAAPPNPSPPQVSRLTCRVTKQTRGASHRVGMMAANLSHGHWLVITGSESLA